MFSVERVGKTCLDCEEVANENNRYSATSN